MMGKNKSKSLYLEAVILLVLGFALFFTFFVRFISEETFMPGNVSLRVLPKRSQNQPQCVFSDSIEYVYYADIPEDFAVNNKFGLYIYAEEEIFTKLADQLVNSNGGDWGYVLIPYNVKDRDKEKWGRLFKQLHSKHLIPVVQLWDVTPDMYKEQTVEAAEFLDEFIWPIKQRYISVYNEPNDAKFWYGEVNPEQYAQILDFTIDTFKSVSEDYYLMNGALNVSASTSDSYLEAFSYMYLMNEEVPGVFNKLDAWASHSYPQPNFSGNPYSTGRWSIRAYEEELNYLYNTLSVQKELPVFITETGWAHAEGKNYDAHYLPVHTVADYFEVAYRDVWLKDDRVRAVFPFTIRFEPPFDHFSWVDNRNIPYAHFQKVKSMKKVSGKPPKLESAKVSSVGCLP